MRRGENAAGAQKDSIDYEEAAGMPVYGETSVKSMRRTR